MAPMMIFLCSSPPTGQGLEAQACIPSAGEAETGRWLGLPGKPASFIGEEALGRDPVSKKGVG